jgi:hypothetical protein
VPANASVAILRTGRTSDETVWENEFFNRRVGQVYSFAVQRVPDPLPETALVQGAGGRLVDGRRRVVSADYVLADGSVDLLGKVVATDPLIGVRLYRVNGPLVVPVRVLGLYPDDTWSGRRVTYERTHCAGGRLAVQLGSDASLFRQTQVVTAREGGRVVGHARIAPAATATLQVPLAPRGGTCTVRFDVARTAVPGHGDLRALGAHFLAFDFRP